MVFFRPVKYINNGKIVTIQLASSHDSEFLFLFTTPFIIILKKDEFLNYFESYRQNHTKSYKYSIPGSIQSYQIIKGFFFTEPSFKFNYLNCQIYTNNMKKQKQTKKSIQTNSSRIQLSFSENKIEQKYSKEIQVFSILDSHHLHLFGLNTKKQFDKVLSIKDDIQDFNINQKLITTSHFTYKLVVYKCFYAIPYTLSKYEKIFTVDLNSIITNIRNYGSNILYLTNSKQTYLFNLQDFQIKKCKPEFRELQNQTEFQSYINLTQPKIEEENNQLLILKNTKITSYLSTYLKYISYNQDIQENNLSNINTYQLIIIGCTQNNQHYIKVVAYYQNQNLVLKAQINHLKSDITSFCYISPYDFGYTDSAGDFGLITFNLEDIGIPIIE